MVWTTVNSRAHDLWDYLARMESFDYVKGVFVDFNEQEADAAKIREINAAFLQGRMYFENASTADMSVKPVLLYYGVFSLRRGLVSFKSPCALAGSLKSSHGLTVLNWKQVLNSADPDVLNLEIKAVLPGRFWNLRRSCGTGILVLRTTVLKYEQHSLNSIILVR